MHHVHNDEQTVIETNTKKKKNKITEKQKQKQITGNQIRKDIA